MVMVMKSFSIINKLNLPLHIHFIRIFRRQKIRRNETAWAESYLEVQQGGLQKEAQGEDDGGCSSCFEREWMLVQKKEEGFAVHEIAERAGACDGADREAHAEEHAPRELRDRLRRLVLGDVLHDLRIEEGAEEEHHRPRQHALREQEERDDEGEDHAEVAPHGELRDQPAAAAVGADEVPLLRFAHAEDERDAADVEGQDADEHAEAHDLGRARGELAGEKLEDAEEEEVDAHDPEQRREGERALDVERAPSDGAEGEDGVGVEDRADDGETGKPRRRDHALVVSGRVGFEQTDSEEEFIITVAIIF